MITEDTWYFIIITFLSLCVAGLLWLAILHQKNKARDVAGGKW